MGGNTSSEKSSGGSKTAKQKKADDAYAKAIDEAYEKNPNVNYTGTADLLKVVQGKSLADSGYNQKVKDAYIAQQAANMEAKNMMADGTQKDDDKPAKTAVTLLNPATLTQAQARAELKKIGPTVSGSGGNYNDLSSFDNYNFSGSPYTLEYFKAVAARAGDGDELNVIHGGSGGKPANTSPSNTDTTTTTGNAASTAESTSADTLKSSQQGVTISDEAKAKAAALNLELVNTDAIQGTNEADTLQKKQAALLEAERRQAIRRLIARNRRARFGGSRLLMSSARANPGLGVPQNQTTLSPRMNPRDIYA
jgi:hypothetical protein